MEDDLETVCMSLEEEMCVFARAGLEDRKKRGKERVWLLDVMWQAGERWFRISVFEILCEECCVILWHGMVD